MIVTALITAAAPAAGLLLPLRWGVAGFLGATLLLFTAQIGIHTAQGFEGTPLSETLLLFNNSWSAYIGFNVQITYRAFALPLLALATPLIYRYSRS